MLYIYKTSHTYIHITLFFYIILYLGPTLHVPFARWCRTLHTHIINIHHTLHTHINHWTNTLTHTLNRHWLNFGGKHLKSLFDTYSSIFQQTGILHTVDFWSRSIEAVSYTLTTTVADIWGRVMSSLSIEWENLTAMNKSKYTTNTNNKPLQLQYIDMTNEQWTNRQLLHMTQSSIVMPF